MSLLTDAEDSGWTEGVDPLATLELAPGELLSTNSRPLSPMRMSLEALSPLPG